MLYFFHSYHIICRMVLSLLQSSLFTVNRKSGDESAWYRNKSACNFGAFTRLAGAGDYNKPSVRFANWLWLR